ncbi:FAD:protein FMN transferase [Uliginosibacterium paludis]|uniref:FAD:protein FMN transferase n=1 Tax=Uliginosibacterium paludis TaxID=1615952 RepID=A0ABV2CMY2_9RHOO
MFGTKVEVVSFGSPEPEARAALAAVLREFDRLHRSYHAWQASDLTRLNDAIAQGKPAQVDDEMLHLLDASRRYATLSDGLFDPAIGHLIELWGFHSDTFVPRLPDPAAVAAAVRAHPSVLDLEIRDHTVSSRKTAVMLDLGGIAKGYALDRAAAILHEHGIRNALINIGGNVMALGTKGKQTWSVGIQHPRTPGPMATLALYDGEAIGTSGDYQRYFDFDGRRYSHLLDPQSGEPARHTEAVTILITPGEASGMRSDVCSKPVFLADQRWRDMARRCGVDHVLKVDSAGRVSVTTAMRARLRWVSGMQADTVVE